MAYKPPIVYKQVGDEIFTNIGQEVELMEREVDGQPNSLFVKYRNANSRVWIKNGKTLRVLAEVDGVVDKDNPLATGVVVCELLERQPFYVRVRVEEPTKNVPIYEEII